MRKLILVAAILLISCDKNDEGGDDCKCSGQFMDVDMNVYHQEVRIDCETGMLLNSQSYPASWYFVGCN